MCRCSSSYYIQLTPSSPTRRCRIPCSIENLNTLRSQGKCPKSQKKHNQAENMYLSLRNPTPSGKRQAVSFLPPLSHKISIGGLIWSLEVKGSSAHRDSHETFPEGCPEAVATPREAKSDIQKAEKRGLASLASLPGDFCSPQNTIHVFRTSRTLYMSLFQKLQSSGGGGACL